MGLFEIGYRRYEGERTSHALRWLPITRSGIRIATRSKLLRRLVLISFLPFLYFGWVFFLIGRITDPSVDPSGPFFAIAREIFGTGLVRQLHEDPGAIRTAVWTGVFGYFGTYFQLYMASVVAAVVGPPLVANDLKTRAFLIYFSRPVSRLDYVLGKAGVLVAFLGAVTLLPSLLLYTLSILFSPSIGTLVQTLPVLGTVILASLGTIVPAALILLALSSLTRQPRFATVTWFVLCLFGPIAYEILDQTRSLKGSDWTFLVSLPHTVRAFQLGLYDMQGHIEHLALRGDMRVMAEQMSSAHSAALAGLWLGALSVLSLFVLLRRVDSPTRI